MSVQCAARRKWAPLFADAPLSLAAFFVGDPFADAGQVAFLHALQETEQRESRRHS
ncbi:hypothetical protein [Streptomyces coeruleofuscus]